MAIQAAGSESAPRKPVPNIASTNKSRALQRAHELVAVELVGDREHVDPDTAPAQPVGRVPPVGTVVALARGDDDAPPVGSAEHPHRVHRDRARRPADEHRLGRARRDRAPVGLGHLRGGHDRLHPTIVRHRGAARVPSRFTGTAPMVTA